MRFLLTISAAILASTVSVTAQCLTDFTKLLPDPGIDYSLSFGRSVSMADDFMAVGVPNSDSLGRLTGVVYMYKKIGADWKRIAAFAPQTPLIAQQFGWNVKLSHDYLLVTAVGGGGKVYLYKKPAGDWASSQELTSFQVTNGVYFGVRDYSLEISDDQQTIAIADTYYEDNIFPNVLGNVFVYHKQPADEWSGSIVPTRIRPPENDVSDFGRAGVEIFGNRIVIGTPFAPTAIGALYIYNDPTGNFSNFTREARLAVGINFNVGYLGFSNIIFNNDGIFTGGAFNDPTLGYVARILYFPTPASGVWVDSFPTCGIDPNNNPTDRDGGFAVRLSPNGTEILASSADLDNHIGTVTLISNGPGGWCDAQYQQIDVYNPPADMLNSYGSAFASNNGTAAVIGFVPLPSAPTAQLALKTFSKNGASWDSQLVYNTKQSTAGHAFGVSIFGIDDFLFVGASHDNRVKNGVGAVYTYKKVSGVWTPTGAILPTPTNPADNVFGSALAGTSDMLAVGAVGFEPVGKVFIYKKTNSDWSNPQLLQEINSPETDPSVNSSFGNKVAMNNNWLVVPFINSAPYRNQIAIYQFNGSAWILFQVVTLQPQFLSKSSTMDVNIDGETILAGNTILERNTSGSWEVRAVLSNSDSEPMRISSDFTHWITDGDTFGFSNSISDNVIMIGAPSKDYLGTWNVGAVYVYVKQPGQSWTSQTETAKLLPRLKDENSLFGYSLDVLFNTLIVGAPYSDYDKNGAPVNRPGRAYVFQSKDYFWLNVTPLLDFTGDSFVKDYFATAVHVDATDFIVGSPIEDIPTGRLSGAVYVTPTPPIIKLVPPICLGSGVVDLLGYPFIGTWTGPGLLSATEGTFDPNAAGPGVHEFTYTTPSCANIGRLLVTIVAPPVVTPLSAPDQFVCTAQSFSKTLGVQSAPGYKYDWYYREKATDAFVSMQQWSPSIVASNRGYYQVIVRNEACVTPSPVMSIADEKVDITITPVSPVCQNASANIKLSAVPPGGTWSGKGISGNEFSPKLVPIGKSTLQYTFKSTNNCIYTAKTDIVVTSPYFPDFEKTGSICSSSGARLSLFTDPPADVNIFWSKKEGSSNLQLQQGGSTLAVNSNGIYMAEARTAQCETTNMQHTVNDALLAPTITPADTELESCDNKPLSLVFSQSDTGSSFVWYYSENSNGPYESVASSGNIFWATKTGYYYGKISAGNCEFSSKPQHAMIHPKDSLFIPNVFTPNGDGKNDVFKVYGNAPNASYFLIDRTGGRVFTSNGNEGWTGGDHQGGVYFWHVSYGACGETKKATGTVTLIR